MKKEDDSAIERVKRPNKMSRPEGLRFNKKKVRCNPSI
jgi:hypothetical protein